MPLGGLVLTLLDSLPQGDTMNTPAEIAEYAQKHYAAAVRVCEGTPRAFDTKTLPKDMTFLGQGMFRRVFRIGNWVVKFDKQAGGFAGNREEFENYERVKDIIPAGFDVPETHFFDIAGWEIVVMEYIDGKRPTEEEHGFDGISSLRRDIRLSDVHNENLVVRDGVKFIVDLGS